MLYVYAVTSSRAGAALPRGAFGERLALVDLGSLRVVVGRAADAPAAHPLTLRRQDLVIRTLARTFDPVLPVRFSTLASDVADLRKLIAPRRKEMLRRLAIVSGAAQMTVRLVGELDGSATDEHGPRSRGRAPAASSVAVTPAKPGTAYLRRRARERRVGSWRVSKLRQALGELVREQRVATPDGVAPLTTVYHLVPRLRVREYRRVVRATLGPTGWRMSGPFPPYAFSEDPRS